MKNCKSYHEALDYIYSFVDYSLSRNLKINKDTFNLNRMRDLVGLLGSPQEKYRTVHVAGTKGKGSTAAFIASALQASGYKTGLYISPHLSDYCERIQVNRQNISHRELVEYLDFMKPMIAKIPEITTFEITTALAFLFFERKHIDYAVIEVGLGGRLDGTNIINPEVSVITSLSMDHMAILGNTLEKIASEKAGIIKPGIPVVSAPQKVGAMQVLTLKTQELNCEFIISGINNEFIPIKHDLKKQVFKLLHKDNPDIVFTLPLLGFHQIINAATSYEAMAILRRSDKKITINSIKKGFRKVKWPARFEIIHRKPIIILDSAHNQESAERLTQTILDYFPGKKIILIFGASEDKDIKGMLKILTSIAKSLIISKSIHPRAMDPEKLLKEAKGYILESSTSRNVEEAIKIGVSNCQKNDIILITGSIFIAAAAREYLMGR